MARRDELWSLRAGGYIEPSTPIGYDILIKGTDKYLNFSTLIGETGYGFRDNNGTLMAKNSGGEWITVLIPIQPTAPDNPVEGQLWIDNS